MRGWLRWAAGGGRTHWASGRRNRALLLEGPAVKHPLIPLARDEDEDEEKRGGDGFK